MTVLRSGSSTAVVLMAGAALELEAAFADVLTLGDAEEPSAVGEAPVEEEGLQLVMSSALLMAIIATEVRYAAILIRAA